LSRQKLEYASLGALLVGDPEALLFVTFFGDTPEEATSGLERLDAAWLAHGHGYFTLRAVTAADQAALLKVRESGLGLLMAASTGTRRPLAFVEDTAVEPAKLASYTARFRQILDSHGLTAGFYGHCSVGCLHIRPFVDLSKPGQADVMRTVAEQVRDLVLEYGGVNSSEHGDGLARSEFNRRMFGDRLYAAMQETKRLFDPANRMNPGKIVDALPMTAHLRDAAQPRAPSFRTNLNFEAAGGMRAAADRCMNIGLCRKESAGVMCPSYMATREEIHSTRGRARILLEALTTDLLPGGFADPALKEALDLCLSCKGCKSECPSSVDMAAYRAEFFFSYYRSHRRPLASAFFGRLNEVAHLASHAPSIANALAHAPIVGGGAKRALAIHPDRELPRFARRTFRSWFQRRTAPRAGLRDVVLFPDTFNNFFEPHVGIAAVGVLERAGFRVIVPREQLCCGRPLYDQGMLAQAKARLKAVLEALDPFVAVGIPIVGLEPSCILTFRDELPSLFPDDTRAGALASNSFLLDELLAREAHNFAPPELRRRTIVHGHCHQKAIAGIGDEVMLLSRAAGAELEVLDAGCCGMAGAFGYDRAHFEVSKAIGARALFPAIEKAPPDAIIVADGFSCRSQIRHFCPSRRPMHLAEVLNLPAGR